MSPTGTTEGRRPLAEDFFRPRRSRLLVIEVGGLLTDCERVASRHSHDCVGCEYSIIVAAWPQAFAFSANRRQPSSLYRPMNRAVMVGETKGLPVRLRDCGLLPCAQRQQQILRAPKQWPGQRGFARVPAAGTMPKRRITIRGVNHSPHLRNCPIMRGGCDAQTDSDCALSPVVRETRACRRFPSRVR